MLVLSRKVGEKILIGDNITVVVNRVSGNRVTLGIQAPSDVHIVRGELEVFLDDEPAYEGTSKLPSLPLSNSSPLAAQR